MSRILDIQKKSNQWVSNFSANVVRILKDNSALMVDMNKAQMLKSQTHRDTLLIHIKTGSPYLSPAYAKRKGKTKPNLFDKGNFQGEMFMSVPDEKDYFIDSSNEKTQWLTDAYGDIFGVAPSNQKKAQAINNSAIIGDYLKAVFQ